MDITQLKSRKSIENVQETIRIRGDVFSLDDLLSAMPEHLFKREDSFRRLFGGERGYAEDGSSPRTMPGVTDSADNDSPSQTYQYNSDRLLSSEHAEMTVNSAKNSITLQDAVNTRVSNESLQTSPFHEELVGKYPNAFNRCGYCHKEMGTSSRSMPCNYKTASHSLCPYFDSMEKIDLPTENGYSVHRLTQYGEKLSDGIPSDEEPDYLLESILKKEKSRSWTQLIKSDSPSSSKDCFAPKSRTPQHLLSTQNVPFQSHSKSRTKIEELIPDCNKLNIEKTYKRYEYRTHEYDSNHQTTGVDSPPDSAVDVDSVSLQSSPSTDIHSLTLWPLSGDVSTSVYHNGGFVNEVMDIQLGWMDKEAGVDSRTATQYTYGDTHQIVERALSPGSLGQKDSDVDSGISHSENSHNHYGCSVNGCYDNSYSYYSYSPQWESMSSSTNQPQENCRCHGVQKNSASVYRGHPKLTASNVKHSLRTRQKRSQTPRNDHIRSGPLKADHSIQTLSTSSSQRHNYDMEKWLLQGARPKRNKESRRSQSSSDQNGKRTPNSPQDYPNARVHFLDETLEMDYLAETLELKGDMAESERTDKINRKSKSNDAAQISQTTYRSNIKKDCLSQYADAEVLCMQAYSPAGMEQHYAHKVLIENDAGSDQSQGPHFKRSTKELTTAKINRSSKQTDISLLDSDHNSSLSESNTETASLVIGISKKKPWQPLAHSAAMDYWSSSCESLATVDSRKEKPHRFRIWKRNKGCYAPNEEMMKQENEMTSQSKNTYVKRPQIMTKSASVGNLYNKIPHPPSQPHSAPNPARRRPSSASDKMKLSDSGSGAKFNEKLHGTMAEDLIAERNKRVEELFKNYTGLDLRSIEKSYQNEANPLPVGRKYSSVNDVRSSSSEIDMGDHETENLSQHQPGRKNVNLPSREHFQHPSLSMDDIRASKEKKIKNQTMKKENFTNGSNPCITAIYDDSIVQIEAPPEIRRRYTSDLEKYKELSASRTSLSERADSFRKSAKRKFSKLRKALSLERIDQGSHVNKESEDDTVRKNVKLKKSSSLRSLKNLFRRKDASSDQKNLDSTTGSTSELSKVENPRHFRPIGRLLRINPDGTQLIELIKPPHGPFGFFIARGNKKYNHGVFISRMSDGHPEKFLSGLLGVGDEILEINNISIKNLSLEAVYDRMVQTPTMLLKTLPFLARKNF